jgi:hypothetical protein
MVLASTYLSTWHKSMKNNTSARVYNMDSVSSVHVFLCGDSSKMCLKSKVPTGKKIKAFCKQTLLKNMGFCNHSLVNPERY